MISYSTVNSGSGTDVDTVIEATKLAREKRPDLAIDEPLQYDAATVPGVGKSKPRAARWQDRQPFWSSPT